MTTNGSALIFEDGRGRWIAPGEAGYPTGTGFDFPAAQHIEEGAPLNPRAAQFQLDLTDGPATGGTFTLSLEIHALDDDSSTQTVVTDPIAHDAPIADVITAITDAMGTVFNPATLNVSGSEEGQDNPLPNGPIRITFTFPQHVVCNVDDDSLVSATIAATENVEGQSGDRGYPQLTEWVDQDDYRLWINFDGEGRNEDGTGEDPEWKDVGAFQDVYADLNVTIHTGSALALGAVGNVSIDSSGGTLTVGADDGPINMAGAGGVSIVSGAAAARIDMADGIALTATSTIRIGVAADETISLYDGAGLAGADRPAIATQVATVDVAAFNALRAALIAFGAIVDGD